MRQLFLMAASLGALAAAGACVGGPETAALSAQRYATPAVAVEPQVGYSDDARHIADCLASYQGYDFRTDTFRDPSGTVRRCPATLGGAAP